MRVCVVGAGIGISGGEITDTLRHTFQDLITDRGASSLALCEFGLLLGGASRAQESSGC